MEREVEETQDEGEGERHHDEEPLAHVTNQVVGPFQPGANLFFWPSGLLILVSSEPTSWTSPLSI
jgi:hypothetical protein